MFCVPCLNFEYCTLRFLDYFMNYWITSLLCMSMLHYMSTHFYENELLDHFFALWLRVTCRFGSFF